ncbi:hypothetical protein KEF29_00650 [Streptomyces tuirus]|uniref:Condensation domain-containing protein n=1 Tax=Streptomyces tuirus TaxID=68278 RepID=A0A941F7P2_9ACTN|nr:hypothetical protein [Streptomyces tuirus]
MTVPREEADTWARVAAEHGMSMPTLLTTAAAAFFRRVCDIPEPVFSLVVNNRRAGPGKSLVSWPTSCPCG